MNQSELQLPKVFEIYLKLAPYPILADRLREHMREEIFKRGVIPRDVFEKEVENKAIQSQQREGLRDPVGQEPEAIWEQRKRAIRDHLTDFYFAYNLPPWLLGDIIAKELGSGEAAAQNRDLTFNPELAPWDLLFAKGHQYEALSPEELSQVWHHLQEIKVVLIKAMISDQLRFVGIAREFLTIADLEAIRAHRLGRGKIGGKAAGLMLARAILRHAVETGDKDLSAHIVVPESHFIGADVFYDFLEINGLLEHLNQKYKTPEQIIADWEDIPARFAQGRFPEPIADELRSLLKRLSPSPLIVRSSSLLEDNVSTSFAGKYQSVFCPNQGTPQENLDDLLTAITQVYASALNPDALLYRQQVGLIDYDERMAVIIQRVQGDEYHRRFFPTLAGVAFSRNPFIWTPRLQRTEGFVRLVTGLGTRAVDRVADDYPRMIGLSHPTLRPECDASKIRHYSQHFMDVVDLYRNEFQTIPVSKVIDQDFPWLRLIASIHRNGEIEEIISAVEEVAPSQVVITMDGLLQQTDFVARMKRVLSILAGAYECPVDVEFTVELRGSIRRPRVILHLLQCRPQSSHEEGQSISLPAKVLKEEVLFSASYLIPNGIVERIRYIVFIDPRQYAALAEPAEKLEIARTVGRINRWLQNERFILMGPGRWGSSNLDLGVKVTYADIFNTQMLIEIGLNGDGGAPEVSHGTHFFQDLVESRIFPLAVFPQLPDMDFDWRFLEESPNLLAQLIPEDAGWTKIVRVIDVPAARDGRLLEVVMSADEERALAYFKQYD